MRKFVILATLIVVVTGILVVSAGWALAATGPFFPGELFYPIQSFAEQRQASLFLNHTGHALALLNLADRRANDLNYLAGTKFELAGIQALDRALDQAEAAIAAAPEEDTPVLISRLAEVVKNAQAGLNTLTLAPTSSPEAYGSLLKKLTILTQLVADPTTATSAQIANQASIQVMLPLITGELNPTVTAGNSGLPDPQSVIFPPGSPGRSTLFGRWSANMPLYNAKAAIKTDNTPARPPNAKPVMRR